MRRYLVTADKDPKAIGDSGGFRIESITEYDPQSDSRTNLTELFDLTEVYSDDLQRLREDIAAKRGVPVDQIEIDLI